MSRAWGPKKSTTSHYIKLILVSWIFLSMAPSAFSKDDKSWHRQDIPAVDFANAVIASLCHGIFLVKGRVVVEAGPVEELLHLKIDKL
jgi:hypothetical protein